MHWRTTMRTSDLAPRWDWAVCGRWKQKRNCRKSAWRTGIKPSGAGRVRRWSGSGGPLNEEDLGRAVPANRQHGPSEAAVHVEPMAVRLIQAPQSPVAAGRQPKGRHKGEATLPGMTMPAETQIDMMAVIQLIENIRRMSQQESVPAHPGGWDAFKIRPMEGRIIQPHNRQFSGGQRQKSHLIDQQRDLVAVERLGKFTGGDAAIVIVIAENHEDRGPASQPTQKTDEMGQPVTNVHQAPGDKD